MTPAQERKHLEQDETPQSPEPLQDLDARLRALV